MALSDAFFPDKDVDERLGFAVVAFFSSCSLALFSSSRLPPVNASSNDTVGACHAVFGRACSRRACLCVGDRD